MAPYTIELDLQSHSLVSTHRGRMRMIAQNCVSWWRRLCSLLGALPDDDDDDDDDDNNNNNNTTNLACCKPKLQGQVTKKTS